MESDHASARRLQFPANFKIAHAPESSYGLARLNKLEISTEPGVALHADIFPRIGAARQRFYTTLNEKPRSDDKNCEQSYRARSVRAMSTANGFADWQ